mgnify:CR=1 FL=1
MMGELFFLSGRIAVIFMFIAGVTGFFGGVFRKFIKPGKVLKLHKWSGTIAILSGLVHGFIYYFYML